MVSENKCFAYGQEGNTRDAIKSTVCTNIQNAQARLTILAWLKYTCNNTKKNFQSLNAHNINGHFTESKKVDGVICVGRYYTVNSLNMYKGYA